MNTINAEEILIPLIKCRCRSYSRIFPAQTQSPIKTPSKQNRENAYNRTFRTVSLERLAAASGCISSCGKLKKLKLANFIIVKVSSDYNDWR